MKGKRSQLIGRGEAYWGVPSGTFRAAWEDYQRGFPIYRVLQRVNTLRDPKHKRMSRTSLLGEWNALGLTVDTRLWKKIRGYQWLRIQSLARAYRLPYWAIIYAALRAAERVEFDPTVELIEAGIPKLMLEARRRWWAAFQTEGTVERHPHRVAKDKNSWGLVVLGSDSELSRRLAGINTPRGGRPGPIGNKRRNP